MAFTASSKQLRLLTRVVEEYCRDSAITDSDKRLYVAELASALFDLGTISMHVCGAGSMMRSGHAADQRIVSSAQSKNPAEPLRPAPV